jgi:ubiquinone/menaquinone biosynthesis C-methylase UbiE
MATTSQVKTTAANLQVYRDPEVVSHYAALDYLTPCERLLFDTYIRPGMEILDIGVGGGRTTPCLSAKASRYVGVDYSAEMIEKCRNKFPDAKFEIADASDLSGFPDDSFDAIVIAFNGIDYLVPEERRLRCLQECSRVLRVGGVLMFSSHNPRSVFVRPDWDRSRLRVFTARRVRETSAVFGSALAVFTAAKAVHSFLRAAGQSMGRILRRFPRAAFWRGAGYVLDPAHGGLMTHCSIPDRVRAEVSCFDFLHETSRGDDYPRHSHSLVTDWYYYVFSKVATMGEPCA